MATKAATRKKTVIACGCQMSLRARTTNIASTSMGTMPVMPSTLPATNAITSASTMSTSDTVIGITPVIGTIINPMIVSIRANLHCHGQSIRTFLALPLPNATKRTAIPPPMIMPIPSILTKSSAQLTGWPITPVSIGMINT